MTEPANNPRKASAAPRGKRETISPSRALEIVLSTARASRPKAVPLEQALGCRLGQDVRADRDQPARDRSAMDGYAVIAGDLAGAPAELTCLGELAAGQTPTIAVRSRTCVAVLTGSCIPRRADAVVPVEQTRRLGDTVTFLTQSAPGENIRRRGEEARRGAVLLRARCPIGAPEAGACAMAGLARPKVYPRPTVAILCTGREVKDAADRVAAHQLRDSNGPAILAALHRLHIPVTGPTIVPDDRAAIAAAVRRAMKASQVVLITGGVSVGTYDFVPGAVRDAGGRIRFHGVAMKPGRPQLFATGAGGRYLFGLPGNPLSAMTGFFELVLPCLRALGGAPRAACAPSTRRVLLQSTEARGKRTCFVLARLVEGPDGAGVEPVRSAGSADLIAACSADGVIVIPPGVAEIPAGQIVEFHSWRPAW